MPSFSGRLILPDDVLEGTLEVEAGRVVAWREGETDAKAVQGWIVPAPVNAHTHAADTFLRDRDGKPATVQGLVGPGGWKSQQLARAKETEVQDGIRRLATEMAAMGTSHFIDFREGGVSGARLLVGLRDELGVAPIVLGRPLRNDFDEDEAAALLGVADGVGLSARRDFAEAAHVELWAEACHKARKPFALHASEVAAEDHEVLVALAPSFLVHCTRASPEGLQAMADADVPAVVCPRSNAHYGMKTPLDRMRRAGLRVAVGTDNGMLGKADLMAELSLLRSWFPAVPTADLLRMATTEARAVAGLATRLPPRAGDPADFIVLPPHPLRASADHRPGFRPGPGPGPALPSGATHDAVAGSTLPRSP